MSLRPKKAVSPSSIPSSPKSIRSSSSAIFERDIEPILSPTSPTSATHAQTNPHRIPRSKATEQLEHAVPSVLDSAAEVLAGNDELDDYIAVVSPVRSRSPSPFARVSPPPSILGLTNVVAPAILYSDDYPPMLSHPSPLSSPPSPPALHLSSSHPPSPVHVAKKRLSFMSYSDLLSSTPASAQPLSALTTSVQDSPPHIPAVSGLNIVNAQIASNHGSRAASVYNLAHPNRRESIIENVGGEWEREGLGRGLEERLDALVMPEPFNPPADIQTVVHSP